MFLNDRRVSSIRHCLAEKYSFLSLLHVTLKKSILYVYRSLDDGQWKLLNKRTKNYV